MNQDEQPVPSDEDALEPLSASELALLTEAIDAWGGAVRESRAREIVFDVDQWLGFASLDADGHVLGELFIAETEDPQTAVAWIDEHQFNEDCHVWLDFAPLGSEDAADADVTESGGFLVLLTQFEPGESAQGEALVGLAQEVSEAWFMSMGGDTVATLSRLLSRMGLLPWMCRGDQLDFLAGEAPGLAYVKTGGERAKVQTFLQVGVDSSEAEGWIARQRPTMSGQLQLATSPNGDDHLLRFVTERHLNPSRIDGSDPYGADAEYLYAAWRARAVAKNLTSTIPPSMGDPRDLEPENAWLLYGDDASFPSAESLAADDDDGDAQIFGGMWTVSKQTREGDLLFFYFIHQRKAIHFVARAASTPWFSGDIEVGADSPVRKTQWWSLITPLVPITPISLSTLREAFDGDLVMRGSSGRYIPPAVAERLIAEIDGEQSPGLARVLQQPTGLANLPDRNTSTFEEWRSIAAGALRLESDVEDHMVEPLFRLAVAGSAELTLKKRFRVGRGIADFAVLDGGQAPRCIIEVKTTVRRLPGSPWRESPDFQQVRRYADALECQSILMDSHHIHLIEPFGEEPLRSIDRLAAIETDLDVVARHVIGPS